MKDNKCNGWWKEERMHRRNSEGNPMPSPHKSFKGLESAHFITFLFVFLAVRGRMMTCV